MSLGVFIPGRLKSQRLANKLVLPIGNTCLWEIACDKLNRLPGKYGKYVLVHDNVLAKIASKYSNISIIRRDKETAECDTPLNFIYKDVDQMPSNYLMFLNPCLLFLAVDTITKSLQLFEESNFEYATSVTTFSNWLFDDAGKPLTPINYKNINTKEIVPLWQMAHCFHIYNKEKFLKDGYALKEPFLPIPVPKEETIDVDTKEDYEFAKWKWENEIRN